MQLAHFVFLPISNFQVCKKLSCSNLKVSNSNLRLASFPAEFKSGVLRLGLAGRGLVAAIGWRSLDALGSEGLVDSSSDFLAFAILGQARLKV